MASHDAPYDRWHRNRPAEGQQPCTCGCWQRPLFPSQRHKVGKRWTAFIPDADGNIRMPCFSTWQEAIAAMADPNFESPALLARASRAPRTVAFYVLQMLQRRRRLGYNKATVKCLESHFRRYIVPLVGQKQASTLTRIDSLTLLEHLRSQRTLKSNNSILGVMRAWAGLVYHMRDEEVPLPANILSRLGTPRQTVGAAPFTAESVAAVTSAMKAIAPRYEIAIWLAACAGLRLGEALGITWDQVDFAENRLSITRQLSMREIRPLKTRASRATLPIDPYLTDKLRMHRQEFVTAGRDEGGLTGDPAALQWIVVDAIDQPLTRNLFNRYWVKARTMSIISPAATYHSLRHYYISTLAESRQYSLTTIQALARHGYLESTLAYVRPIDNPDKRGVTEFGTAFAQHDQVLSGGS